MMCVMFCMQDALECSICQRYLVVDIVIKICMHVDFSCHQIKGLVLMACVYIIRTFADYLLKKKLSYLSLILNMYETISNAFFKSPFRPYSYDSHRTYKTPIIN